MPEFLTGLLGSDVLAYVVMALLPLFLGLGWWPWLGVTLLREA